MANQRDIDRWKRGKDHWNKWATGRLKAKAKLEKERKWEVNSYGDGANAQTKRWVASASVDFFEHIFEEDANFNGFLFPYKTDFQNAMFRGIARFDGLKFDAPANFESATFEERADFGDARFERDVWFGGTRFEKDAWFGHVTIKGDAWFADAIFDRDADFGGARVEGEAWFDDARFEALAWFADARFAGHARFDHVNFNGYTTFGMVRFEGDAAFDGATFCIFANFAGTRFENAADFAAILVERTFTLESAYFCKVPNFIQAHFSEAPRLDNLAVPQSEPFKCRGDAELAARYRALKRIALHAHDHIREQEFFSSEARERRGNDDPKWSPNWFFSFPYEFFADFGRSIAAPFWWWCGSTIAFWFVYLGQRDFTANLKCKIDPTWEALYLSLKSAFLVIGWERSHKLNQVYSCLYGGELQEPNLPVGIPFIQMGQTLWSAVLIFLFLLAVRNHFRIK